MNNSRIQSGYDRWASVYDHDENPLVALEETIIRGVIGDPRSAAVLDMGCGTGRHAVWLANAGATVTAVDFSEGMLAEAKTKSGAESVRFQVHDLHRPLPFADGSFDLVVSGLVLEHIHDLPFFFRQARRVVKAGGRTVVSAMHPSMFLRDKMASFTDPDTGEKVRPGSFPHSISEFVMAAQEAAFQIRKIQEYAPNADLAQRFPRAAKYVGWPMLVVMDLSAC